MNYSNNKVYLSRVSKKEVYLFSLKQINVNKGYSYADDLTSYDNIVGSEFSDEIHKVLVKRCLFGKFKEVLTNVKFDSIFAGQDIQCSYHDELVQTSKIVHTYVDAHRLYMTPATNKKILEYVEEHKDVEAYKQSLIELKQRGEQRAIAAIKRDIAEHQNKVNERKRVRALLKNSALSNK